MIEQALRRVCASLSLSRFGGLDELSSQDSSTLEDYGLDCFRLGMEFQKDRDRAQRTTRPPPPEDDER